MTGRRSNNRRVFPEQEVYERLRPLVLFGETAASRAKETGGSPRTLRYQADQFEQYGMASLFPKEPASPRDPGRNLPPEMRQLIVDRKRRTSRFPSPRAGPDLLSALWPQALGPHHQTHLGRWSEAFSNRTTIPTLRPDRRWVSAPPRHCGSSRGRVVKYNDQRLSANASPPRVRSAQTMGRGRSRGAGRSTEQRAAQPRAQSYDKRNQRGGEARA